MTAEERRAEEMSAAEAAGAAGLDITAKRDGGVLKVVKKEGTGTDCPMIGDKVTVHYTGWLLDGTKFDSSRDRKDKFSFDFGKGGISCAWKRATRLDQVVSSEVKNGSFLNLHCLVLPGQTYTGNSLLIMETEFSGYHLFHDTVH